MDFSGTPVSSTNKTDRHDITEILLKVALNTITITPLMCKKIPPWRPLTSSHSLQRNVANVCVECVNNDNSNMTSFRFVDKRAIYRFGIISIAHASVHVNDFSVVNVHVDELSSAWIWQHKMCATFSINVNINYRLLIDVYFRICTLRHIRIEIN